MIINGRGYICKKCRRTLMSDDVTYFASGENNVPVASTNCCHAKVVKPGWWDKLWKR